MRPEQGTGYVVTGRGLGRTWLGAQVTQLLGPLGERSISGINYSGEKTTLRYRRGLVGFGRVTIGDGSASIQCFGRRTTVFASQAQEYRGSQQDGINVRVDNY